MNGVQGEHYDQGQELLAERALEAFESGSPVPAGDLAGEAAETERALRGYFETAGLALAAFAADSVDAQLPTALRARLSAAGAAFCADRQRKRSDGANDRAAIPSTPLRALPPIDESSPRGPGRDGLGRSPFAFGAVLGAAAAFVIVWLLGAFATPDPVARREALLAQGGRQATWSTEGMDTSHGAISGDVTWTEQGQDGGFEGYMRIEGLQPLDPEQQYQLWIVDRDRDPARPVDGGLFDRQTAEEAVIPIRAKLPVGEATTFLITVEKRGGVVVSSRDVPVGVAVP